MHEGEDSEVRQTHLFFPNTEDPEWSCWMTAHSSVGLSSHVYQRRKPFWHQLGIYSGQLLVIWHYPCSLEDKKAVQLRPPGQKTQVSPARQALSQPSSRGLESPSSISQKAFHTSPGVLHTSLLRPLFSSGLTSEEVISSLTTLFLAILKDKQKGFFVCFYPVATKKKQPRRSQHGVNREVPELCELFHTLSHTPSLVSAQSLAPFSPQIWIITRSDFCHL